MPLRLVMLEQARSCMAFGPEQFFDEYPGVFLLAVGLVAAEPVAPAAPRPRVRRAETQEIARLDIEDIEDTFSMPFNQRLTHSVDDHPLAGCTFFLPATEQGTQTVGRKPGCDLTIPDISVSDHHCQIQLVDGIDLFVTDLGSTNGTLVNLQRLSPGEPTLVEDEAVVTVGRYSFQYFTAQSLYAALSLLEQSR